mmetsp:Transcript_174661/g.560121  ORF Transcript_174661/g.560121 Transcript_174661/m.560121 type:complete len:237 (+) Transcript_174661:1044-1754(+)
MLNLLPQGREEALDEHVVVLRDHVRVPAPDLVVVRQGQRQRVGREAEVGAQALVSQTTDLEQQRAETRQARDSGHRKEVPEQQHRGLPDGPRQLLGGLRVRLVRERVEVLRVPHGVRITNADDHARRVTFRDLVCILPEGLTVSPLRVRGLAGELPQATWRVECRNDVSEEVLGSADQALGLLSSTDLPLLHAEDYPDAPPGRRRQGDVGERFLQHVLILLVVGEDHDVHDLALSA